MTHNPRHLPAPIVTEAWFGKYGIYIAAADLENFEPVRAWPNHEAIATHHPDPTRWDDVCP